MCFWDTYFWLAWIFFLSPEVGCFLLFCFFFLTSISIAPVPRSPMLCITLGCSILSRRASCNSRTPDTLFQSETCIAEGMTAQKNDVCSLFGSVAVLQLRNSPAFQLCKRISFLLPHFLSLSLSPYIYVCVYICVWICVFRDIYIFTYIYMCIIYIWRQRYKYICVYI